MSCETKRMYRRENYLSLENSSCLKGILCICIILCHIWGPLVDGNPYLAENIIGSTIGRICAVLGYLSVAMFLFLSGYGLCVQHQKKGQQYLNGFLLKRVLPLYLINVLLIVFYTIADLLLKETISWGTVAQSFLFGKTVVSKGWYLQAILVWYIFFLIVFKFIKSDTFQIIAMLGAFIIYLGVCLIMKLESTWYEGALCLVLGIIWGKYFRQINEVLSKNKWLAFSIFVCGILFMISFILGNFNFLPKTMRIVSKSFSASTFTILVVLFLKIIPINNIITRFLGKISLEIYVFHGFFLELYRCRLMYVENWILYTFLVFASTIFLAWAMRPLFSMIFKLGKKEKKSGNEN